MKQRESHPIRNGIITSVAGGIILSFWPPFRAWIDKIFSWLWNSSLAIWDYLWLAHDVYGWLIIILVLLSLPTIIDLIAGFKNTKEPGHTELYREDYLFGAKWHWNYVNGSISNLWCLCPQCDNELVYSEYIPDPYRFEERDKSPRTEFICERCRVSRASMEGKKSYALGTVEREIRRKIRTNEWKPNGANS